MAGKAPADSQFLAMEAERFGDVNPARACEQGAARLTAMAPAPPRKTKIARGSGFSRDEATAACQVASRLKPLPPGPGLTFTAKPRPVGTTALPGLAWGHASPHRLHEP